MIVMICILSVIMRPIYEKITFTLLLFDYKSVCVCVSLSLSLSLSLTQIWRTEKLLLWAGPKTSFSRSDTSHIQMRNYFLMKH
jgi:hypothetical protein